MNIRFKHALYIFFFLNTHSVKADIQALKFHHRCLTPHIKCTFHLYIIFQMLGHKTWFKVMETSWKSVGHIVYEHQTDAQQYLSTGLI